MPEVATEKGGFSAENPPFSAENPPKTPTEKGGFRPKRGVFGGGLWSRGDHKGGVCGILPGPAAAELPGTVRL